MTAILPTISEDDVVRVVGDFISTIVDCQVIRGQRNRVSMPAGESIVMTPAHADPLATNTVESNVDSQDISRSTRFIIRIDAYGEKASERAMAISTLLRDDFACRSFKDSGLDIQPLYAGDAQQLPLISGEQQYIERWTFEAVLQYNPVLTVPQDTANTLTVDLTDVMADYKP